jgi:CheY-like chemotaxis protein
MLERNFENFDTEMEEEERIDELELNDVLQLQGKRTLIVEDNPDTRALMSRVLGGFGIKTECANDGREGIEKVKAMEPDVVLMDLMMPEVDGFQAVEEIRRHGYSGPIIALTAWVDPDIRRQCLRMGFDDYLTKPIDRARLFHVMSELISQTDSGKMH